MTEAEIAWVAGFLEGEGSFCTSGVASVRVIAAQVEIDPLERLRNLFGGRLNGPYDRGSAPIYTWKLSGEAARTLMISVRPWMSRKRKRQIDSILGGLPKEIRVGRKITCLCGTCKKCRNRVWMRSRAKAS